MKTLMSTLFVIVAAAGMAMAADKPDFSGDWKMDADKSSFGQTPPLTSLSVKIDHKEPTVSMVKTQSGAQGDQVLNFKYSTDGKETTNSLMGNDVKSKAGWEGKALVVNSSLDAGGMLIKLIDKFTLSDDGKTLTEVLTIAGTPQGDLEITYVLVKQ
jgi:hypothetical protein